MTIAVIALALLNIGLITFFMTGKKSKPPKRVGPKKIIIERLKLDEGQIAAYEKLIEKHQIDMDAKNTEVGEAQNILFKHLQNNSHEKRDSLTNIIGQLNQEMAIIHFEHFKELKQLCKPEQINAFNELTSELGNYFLLPRRKK